MLDFNDNSQFRELKDYPGYGVGADGTVWSRRTSGQAHVVAKEWKPLKLKQNSQTGYLHFRPCVNKKNITATVHSLVLLAFVGPPPIENAQCRHLDGDKLNNRLENLQWGTATENASDRGPHGRVPNARLNDDKVKAIRAMYATGNYLQRELGAMFGVNRRTIESVVNNRSWTHVG